jgi:hypothetical protein
VGRPDFKPGWGCRAVPGRFDSCSLPPMQGTWGRFRAVASMQQCGSIDAPPLAINKLDSYGCSSEKGGVTDTLRTCFARCVNQGEVE